MTDALLDSVEEFLERFIAFPSEPARVATTLWAGHAHMLNAFESTPRLAFLSPEPGSGKTRALELLELLTPRPLHAVNASPAALFRRVSSEDGRPTILFDEIDTVFGPKAKENEDLRGLLNAGHRRGATATRCVVRGKEITVEDFPAYAAVAVAGLGDLPDTLMSRSVVIRMRRRAPTEIVEPFRYRVHAPDGHKLRDQLAAWAAGVEDRVSDAWPDMPAGVEDRNADVWEPLLAVADAAGGIWPVRARVAAVSLVTQSSSREGSLGVRLLGDLRQVFGEHDRLPTDTLLEKLCDLDDAPWGDLRGKPIDSRGLARRLRQYDVAPKVIRVGEGTVRGYERCDLHDAWTRYLEPPQPSKEHVTSETPQQVNPLDAWQAPTCRRCAGPLYEVDLLAKADTCSACDLVVPIKREATA